MGAYGLRSACSTNEGSCRHVVESTNEPAGTGAALPSGAPRPPGLSRRANTAKRLANGCSKATWGGTREELPTTRSKV